MLIELDDKSKTQWQKHIDVICRKVRICNGFNKDGDVPLVNLGNCDVHIAINYADSNKYPSTVAVEFAGMRVSRVFLSIIFINHFDIVVFNAEFTRKRQKRINLVSKNFWAIRDLAVKAFESQGVY
ncbi:MAG: hypothetical protein KDK05_16720 [Candidatus Competibacteraceae bacterium]|nr:hypothetical protein [Candidatus Competibacteraceae bacterium]